jgi:hypothetical protein
MATGRQMVRSAAGSSWTLASGEGKASCEATPSEFSLTPPPSLPYKAVISNPALLILYRVQPHNVLTLVTLCLGDRAGKRSDVAASRLTQTQSVASSGSIDAINKTRLWILKRVTQHDIKIKNSMPRKQTILIQWFGKVVQVVAIAKLISQTPKLITTS